MEQSGRLAHPLVWSSVFFGSGVWTGRSRLLPGRVEAAQFGVNLKQLERFGGCGVVVQRLEVTARRAELIGAVAISTALGQLAEVALDQMLGSCSVPAGDGSQVLQTLLDYGHRPSSEQRKE